MAIVATSSVPVSTPVSSDGNAARCSPLRSTDNAARPEHRAPERAASAEDRRAAENDRRDGVELVSGSRIRFRLPEMRDVDDRRDARRPARTADTAARAAARPGSRRIARPSALNPITYQARPTHRSMQQDRIDGEDGRNNSSCVGTTPHRYPWPERRETAAGKSV